MRSLDATERALARIADRDGLLRAWAELDESGARAQAREVDASADTKPLAGLTLGVKDIIDVGGLQCECGSPIFAGRRAFADAVLVAQLKALGMVVVGKTATAEFAYLQAPATRNPRDLGRSPGGSSSGSAAAVADHHVDAALGTQTAGSIIRPAAFCGTVGFKPTYGRFSRVGVLSASPAVDTIGWLTGTVDTASRMWMALTGEAPIAAAQALGFCRTVHWHKAELAMRDGMEALAGFLSAKNVASPPATLDDTHAVIMRHEMRQELMTQTLQHPTLLSPGLSAYLAGDPIVQKDYLAALAARDAFDLDALFAGVDVLLTPAACGEAVPYGSTGDPCFNRFATLLGLPVATIPFGAGENGLPLGLQLIARPHRDGMLLATAAVIEAALDHRQGSKRESTGPCGTGGYSHG